MAKFTKIAEEIAKNYDGVISGNKVMFKTLKDALDGADDIADRHGYTIDMDIFEIEFLNENIDVNFIHRVYKNMSGANVPDIMKSFGFTNENENEAINLQIKKLEKEKKYIFEYEDGEYFSLNESQMNSLKEKNKLERKQFLTHMGMRDLHADDVAENLALLKKTHPEMDDNGHLPVEGAGMANENMTPNNSGLWMFGGIEVLGRELLKTKHHLTVNESGANSKTFTIHEADSSTPVASGVYSDITGIEVINEGNEIGLEKIIDERKKINESTDDYLFLKFADNVLYFLDFTKPLVQSEIDKITNQLIESGVFPAWLGDSDKKEKLNKALKIRKDANYMNESAKGEFKNNGIFSGATGNITEAQKDYKEPKNINEPKNLAREIQTRFFSKGEKISRGGVKEGLKTLAKEYMINESFNDEANFIGLMNEVEKMINESGVAYLVPKECFTNPWLTHKIESNSGIRGYQFANQYGNAVVNAVVGGQNVGVYVNESNQIAYTSPIPKMINESGTINNIEDLKKYADLRINESEDYEEKAFIVNTVNECEDDEDYGKAVSRIDEYIDAPDAKEAEIIGSKGTYKVKERGGRLFYWSFPNGRWMPVARASVKYLNESSFSLYDFLNFKVSDKASEKQYHQKLSSVSKDNLIELGKELKVKMEEHKKSDKERWNMELTLFQTLEDYVMKKYKTSISKFLNESEEDEAKRLDEAVSSKTIKDLYKLNGFNTSQISVRDYGGARSIIFAEDQKNMSLAKKIADKFGLMIYKPHPSGVGIRSYTTDDVNKIDGVKGDPVKHYNNMVINESAISLKDVDSLAKKTSAKQFDKIYKTFNAKDLKTYNSLIKLGDSKEVALWSTVYEKFRFDEEDYEYYRHAYIGENGDMLAHLRDERLDESGFVPKVTLEEDNSLYGRSGKNKVIWVKEFKDKAEAKKFFNDWVKEKKWRKNGNIAGGDGQEISMNF